MSGWLTSIFTRQMKCTTASTPATYARWCSRCQRRIAEPPDRRGRRGQRQRHQQHQGQEPDGDERPLGDVLDDDRPIEALVQHEVGQEVQHGVEEGEQAELAADRGPARSSPSSHLAGVQARLATRKISAASPSSLMISAIGLALSVPWLARSAIEASGASAPMKMPGFSQGIGVPRAGRVPLGRGEWPQRASTRRLLPSCSAPTLASGAQ